LFLQSGNALLGIIVISVFLIIKYISFSLKNIIVLVLLSVALVSSGVYYLRSEIGSLVKERIDNPEEDFSAFLRIYRGYYVYSAFDIEYKIIGNNNRDYLRDSYIYMKWTRLIFLKNRHFLINLLRCSHYLNVINHYMANFKIRKQAI
jgi:hypothetical protein